MKQRTENTAQKIHQARNSTVQNLQLPEQSRTASNEIIDTVSAVEHRLLDYNFATPKSQRDALSHIAPILPLSLPVLLSLLTNAQGVPPPPLCHCAVSILVPFYLSAVILCIFAKCKCLPVLQSTITMSFTVTIYDD